MAAGSSRWLFLLLGWASLACGLVGIALPLLPTTPFLLLAAYSFARGSERMHDWLVNHAQLGPPIAHWHEHGAISRRAKWLATLSLLLVLGLSCWLALRPLLLLIQGLVLIAVATFLWSRPEPPANSS